MTHSISVRHNFETAHRLPHLPGKCQSLHGHSWWAEVTVTAPEPSDGLVVEFGPFKTALRAWIDNNLDHGVMLATADPLVPVLRDHQCKVFLCLDWPTVENTAALLGSVAQELLDGVPHAPAAKVARVTVRETHVNQATWDAP